MLCWLRFRTKRLGKTLFEKFIGLLSAPGLIVSFFRAPNELPIKSPNRLSPIFNSVVALIVFPMNAAKFGLLSELPKLRTDAEFRQYWQVVIAKLIDIIVV